VPLARISARKENLGSFRANFFSAWGFASDNRFRRLKTARFDLTVVRIVDRLHPGLAAIRGERGCS
jgi:hypothetical protein